MVIEMNPEMLIKAGIDYDHGVRRFMGRAHLYEKTLLAFLRDDTFRRMSASYESGDMKKFFETVHEFKGMCGNISMTALFTHSDKIVKMLRSGDYTPEQLDSVYRQLAGDYKIACDAISDTSEAPA